jgi:hypothetical protein
MDQINVLPKIVNPDFVGASTPSVSGILSLPLSEGLVTVNGRVYLMPQSTVVVPPYSSIRVDAAIVGQGLPRDFKAGDIIYQPTGSFVGQYLSTVSMLRALSAINISLGMDFTIKFSAQLNNNSGGWGPGLVDINGNGFFVRAANGSGGIYTYSNGVLGSTALTTLNYNSANSSGLHSFVLHTQFQDGQYNLSIYIDNVLVGSIVSPSAMLANGVYPAFLVDGASLYLTSWGWAQKSGVPVASWILNDGSDHSIVGKHVWRVTSNATSITTIDAIYERKTVTNQLAACRNILQQLQSAYL